MKKVTICIRFENYEMYRTKWEEKGYKLKRVDMDKDKGGQLYSIMQFIKEENE